MKTGRLRDVARLDYGFAFDSKHFNAEGNGLPLVRIRDVVRGQSDTYYSGGYDDRYLVRDGDYLIGMDGQFNLARWQGGTALLNQRVCRIGVLDPCLDRDYLGRYMPLALKTIEDVTPFVTVKHLSARALGDIELPLPPIAEQRRIAAILDQADALRAKRRQVLTHLGALPQAIFHEMFSGTAATATVGQVAADTKGSIRTGPFGSQLLHGEFVNDGVAVLGLDNVVGNEFRWAGRRFITAEKYEQLRRYTVHPGDVLISIMGTTGRCVIVPDDIPAAINTKHICAVTADSETIDPAFLRAAFLWHPESRAHLRRQTKGSIMEGLNMGIIKAMPVPVPPLRVQQVFAERVAFVECRRGDTFRARGLDDELFASLQSRAFRGEL